jgi:hypothetical protein
MISIDNASNTLKDVVFHYMNGTSNKLEAIELTALSIDIDPNAVTDDTGAIWNVGNKGITYLPIVLPLNGVSAIEFNKNVGGALPFYLRTEILNQ